MDEYYGYRKLAGAIIANALEDMVQSMVFIRDIDTPQYQEMIHKRAEKAYKKYKKMLDDNQASKRWHRDKVRALRVLLNENKRNLQAHREGIEKLEFPTINSEERSLAREAVAEYEKQLRNHAKGIATCKENIADAEERIANHLRKVKKMKRQERYFLKQSSYKAQKKALLKRARYEIQCAEEWFNSDQFIKLNAVSQLSPESMVELARMKVRQGFKTDDKPYYLRKTTEGRDNL